MFELMFWVAILVVGTVLMVLSSDKAVEHSVFFASALGISPLMIGFTLVSLGTDLPEIINSLLSSAIGHGNINVGDSIGSVLTQLTLVLGILTFFGPSFKVKRKEVLITGSSLILALMLIISIVEKGYISRINALFLIFSWPIYTLLTRSVIGQDPPSFQEEMQTRKNKKLHHIVIAVLGFIGVAVGAYAVIQSIIALSATFRIPEYILSFFLLAIGTSLPELAVDLTALRKREYEIVIGDIIGSCVIDASFSIGIGQVFFPQTISGEIAALTILYTLLASFLVVFTLAVRQKLDKKSGVFFIGIYSLSYLFLFI